MSIAKCRALVQFFKLPGQPLPILAGVKAIDLLHCIPAGELFFIPLSVTALGLPAGPRVPTCRVGVTRALGNIRTAISASFLD